MINRLQAPQSNLAGIPQGHRRHSCIKVSLLQGQNPGDENSVFNAKNLLNSGSKYE
jgi:hypothetical protein